MLIGLAAESYEMYSKWQSLCVLQGKQNEFPVHSLCLTLSSRPADRVVLA